MQRIDVRIIETRHRATTTDDDARARAPTVTPAYARAHQRWDALLKPLATALAQPGAVRVAAHPLGECMCVFLVRSGGVALLLDALQRGSRATGVALSEADCYALNCIYETLDVADPLAFLLTADDDDAADEPPTVVLRRHHVLLERALRLATEVTAHETPARWHSAVWRRRATLVERVEEDGGTADECSSNYCDACDGFMNEPKRCGKCHVPYCSPECQRAGWRAHRTLCPRVHLLLARARDCGMTLRWL